MTQPFSFNKQQFNRLFPFYILINRDLKVIGLGKSLSKMFDLEKIQQFNHSFSIPRPLTPINSFSDLIELQDRMIVLEWATSKKLMLRGQFEYLKESDQVLFVGSPWFGSMEQVTENNLSINDFATHDPLIDLLHVLKSQEITNEDLKGLVATINEQKNALRGINSFAANMLNLVTIDEIVWAITDHAISQFNLEDCVIYLLDENKVLIQRAAYGNKRLDQRKILNPIKIKFGRGIVGKVASTGKPIIINDTSKAPHYIVDDKIRYSELAVPIIANNEVIGVIDSEHSSKFFFNKEHITAFSTIANLSAIKIKNALIQEEHNLLERNREIDRKKYVNIVENASEIIYEISNSGFITFINNVFFKKTGYSLKEIKNKYFLDMVPEKFREEVSAKYINQIKNKLSDSYAELPIVTKSGEVMWIAQNVNMEYDKDGLLIESTIVARDITKRKIAEEKNSKFVLGVRKNRLKSMPGHRVLSNVLTSYIISWFTGQQIKDSQCGFRLIHRDVLKKIKLTENGYQLESEMLLESAKKGFLIDWVSIPTIYNAEKSYIGHFSDTFRFTRLMFRELKGRMRWSTKSE